MTSPFKNLDVSCKPCHRQSTDWLKEKVLDVQNRTNELVDTAGEENARVILAIEEASKTAGVNEAKLKEARETHRRAQGYWDWVAAENSMGFHNSSKAMGTLGLAINEARHAQILASEAAGKVLNPHVEPTPKQQTDQTGEKKQPGDKPEFPSNP